MRTDLSALRDQVVHQPPLPLYLTKQLVSILSCRHCLSDDLHYNYPIAEHVTLGSWAWHWSTRSLSGASRELCTLSPTVNVLARLRKFADPKSESFALHMSPGRDSNRMLGALTSRWMMSLLCS